MRTPWIAALAAPLLLAGAATPTDFDHSHRLWTEVLRTHAREGGFDYRALKKQPGSLRAYLDTLEAVTAKELASWGRPERYVFWINAYNAYTIQRVVDGYPVKSIKDLGSPQTSVWKQRFIPLGHLYPKAGDEKLTLDELEHSILRPRFRDARVHAAVNCASVGCPPLLDRAFTARELEKQLDAQVQVWLADPSRNRFERTRRTVHLSRIFDWFRDDFERDGETLPGWLARYAPAEHAAWLRSGEVEVEFLEYEWGLNEAPPKKETEKEERG